MLANFFSELSGLEKVYLYAAIIGGTVFLIKLVLMFVGGDFSDSDADVDVDGLDGADGVDVDAHTDVHDVSDTDISFHLLSIQGLAAFFMIFGLTGLTLLQQAQMTPAWSIFGGVCAGGAMIWLLKKLFELARGLQSSGTLDLKEYAVGSEGSVYLTIPPGGTGKVRVPVQNHLKVFEAQAEDRQEIKTGEDIKVVNVISDNILIVNKRS